MDYTAGEDKTKNDDAEAFSPARLLDRLIELLQVKNDAELSRALEVSPPIVSKLRHNKSVLGPALLIRMHEVSGLTIRDLRYLAGDRRRLVRMSPTEGQPDLNNFSESR